VTLKGLAVTTGDFFLILCLNNLFSSCSVVEAQACFQEGGHAVKICS